MNHKLALICNTSLCFSLISYTEQYIEYDPFLTAPEPCNPWTSDDTTFWDLEARYCELLLTFTAC